MIIADMFMAVKILRYISNWCNQFNILQNIYLKNKKQMKIFTTIFHFFFHKGMWKGTELNINKSPF